MKRKIIAAWCTLYDDGVIIDDCELKFDEGFEEDKKKIILERFRKRGYIVITLKGGLKNADNTLPDGGGINPEKGKSGNTSDKRVDDSTIST